MSLHLRDLNPLLSGTAGAYVASSAEPTLATVQLEIVRAVGLLDAVILAEEWTGGVSPFYGAMTCEALSHHPFVSALMNDEVQMNW